MRKGNCRFLMKGVTSLREVYITLNSFNQEQLKQKGQQSFIESVQESGAEGIEFRRELLRSQRDFMQISQVMKGTTLKAAYSAPVPIWNKEAQLNRQKLQEASLIDAELVKFPLGHFDEQNSSMEELAFFLRDVSKSISLMVENDQTFYGGNIKTMKRFGEKCEKYQIDIPFVFDSGNWHYVNESFQSALQEIGRFVGYLHLKQVVKNDGLCTTIALIDEEKAEWKQAINQIRNVPVAIEFPLESNKKAKHYVELIRKNCQEEVNL